MLFVIVHFSFHWLLVSVSTAGVISTVMVWWVLKTWVNKTQTKTPCVKTKTDTANYETKTKTLVTKTRTRVQNSCLEYCCHCCTL